MVPMTPSFMCQKQKNKQLSHFHGWTRENTVFEFQPDDSGPSQPIQGQMDDSLVIGPSDSTGYATVGLDAEEAIYIGIEGGGGGVDVPVSVSGVVGTPRQSQGAAPAHGGQVVMTGAHQPQTNVHSNVSQTEMLLFRAMLARTPPSRRLRSIFTNRLIVLISSNSKALERINVSVRLVRSKESHQSC
ncbi:hypothetical protein BT69DRAFT_191573 [Atractiella rhizophila]|nr:hypothetical protein BT69DRAFT_191573 [Atractiella rhizophila]